MTDHNGTNAASDDQSGIGHDGGAGPQFDVVVVGAGFAGLYLLHRLRGLGLRAVVLESADDIGGTWYWNRYPGARCDIQSVDYSYSFDPELEHEWQWSERYATQPEILRYLDHVATKHDLRSDIRFGQRVVAARWDDDARVWQLRSDSGEELTCRHYVMATGCLSVPKDPDIEGVDRFGGEVYYTGRWPHDEVDFTGKRVGVIGTGSSGIQSIPIIAEQASELTVFQRTANFSVPAHNGPVRPEKLSAIDGRWAEYREEARWSRGGVPGERIETMLDGFSEAERRQRLDEAWEAGELFAILGVFADQLINPASNEVVADFIRDKIRERVDDPQTAELLCPTDHPFGTKRPCLDTNYFETFNRPHVTLVDLRSDPITSITETGIDTASRSFEFDAIVYATGFDAMTGAIVAVDVEGRDGVKLADRWADGPHTYLGLTAVGFPNFFMVTGPGSPSVLSNMAVSIEQHVDWIVDCIDDLRSSGHDTIEPTPTAEAGWGQHVLDCGDITLYPQANSWYMGANVPGKPRVFLPYIGGVDAYRQICDEVAEQDYLGFTRTGAGGSTTNDGVVRQLQPDVSMLLEAMAEMELPPIESMSPEEARAFSAASAEQRPPGPEVGEIVDGALPGPTGELAYRIYRPADVDGPPPVVVYFHGGGWVLGSEQSDDPMCRDLCVRSGAMIVSVDYRHAPEHRHPAAVDDGYAALRWVAEHAEELGGRPGPVVVAGWSAGANVAAVACQRARDDGWDGIAGQVLITPVTDCDLSRGSYEENAEGYVLTTALMQWFWDHYADEADRADPSASPLRGDLSGLPPALVVTSQFDPLRDEGRAYAEALSAAGVDARYHECRGQTHTTIGAVDMIISSGRERARIAEALADFFATEASLVAGS